jgi:hypothetical protein
MCLHPAVRLSLFLFATVVPLVARAQFQAPSKEELQMTSDPKAPGAPAVYLERIETTDDPHHFVTVYARIKILSEKGLEAATVHVTYQRSFVFHASGDNSSRMASGVANHWDAPNVNHSGEDRPFDTDSFNVKSEISALEGRTIQPDGTIVPLTGAPADLLKVKQGHNQTNELTFNLPDVQVGSIIEYRYQIRYDRYEGAADWEIQKPYFTHHEHFSFTPDEHFSVLRNKFGTAGVQGSALVNDRGETLTDVLAGAVLPPNAVVKSEASGVYTLDIADVPPLPVEPFSPPAEGRAYRVGFYYVAWPDLKDYWQREMNLWNKKLNQYTDSTNSLKSTVQEVLKDAATESDKAKRLYEISQKIENIDFSSDGEPGIGTAWIPQGNVEQVLLEKKGTSNQIAYLYYALARAAGLNVRVERIASRSERLFSLQFRDPSQLDTALIVLNIDGKDIIVDPGTRMAPFQTLHWAHAAAGGLALINGKIEPIITPEQKVTENTVIRIGSLDVSPRGAISGTIKVAFIGQEALRLRQLGLRSGADGVKAEIDRMLAAEVPAGMEARVDHVAYLDDPNRQLLAIVPVSGTLAQAGSHLALPRSFFDTRQGNPFPAENVRINPVDGRFPGQTQDQITYVIPAGFTLEGKPQDSLFKWEGNAAYEARTKFERNSITNSRILARGFTLLEPNEYVGLHDFFQKVAAASTEELVLTPANQAVN